MKLGGILVALVAAALLLWWGFGKPGLWLRDRLCWIDDLSPGDGAVVQWRVMDQPVRVSGRTSWLARDVAAAATQAGEVREVDASDLKWVAAARTLGGFEVEVPLRRGWNHLLVRCRWWDQRATYAQRVALGEVFIVAGQSNAAGWSGSLFLGGSGDVRLGTLGGGGIRWRNADDPQVVFGGGSVWPLVGQELSSKTGAAVGFINVAEGGSSVRDWQKGGRLYARLLQALKATQPYYVQAILWAQGESDSDLTSEQYAHYLSSLIELINADLQSGQYPVPWVLARSSYNRGEVFDGPRDGVDAVVRSGFAQLGPDTDLLGREYREADDVHLNGAGTRAAAALWAEVLMEDFYSAQP
jgi:lysophospholipase L1-like esterase